MGTDHRGHRMQPPDDELVGVGTAARFLGCSPTKEPVREFESEIHKSLPLNNLQVLSLIKVDSLLARTYVS